LRLNAIGWLDSFALRILQGNDNGKAGLTFPVILAVSYRRDETGIPYFLSQLLNYVLWRRLMRKVYRFLCKVEETICGIGFMFLVGFIFLSAILRFFRVSMSWNIDLAMFLLAWTAFLGADIAWRNGQLVGIDIVTRNLPKVAQKIIQIALYIIIFVALALIAVFGLKLAYDERVRTYQSIPIPYSLVTLSIVVAAFSMLVSTIGKIRRAIVNFNEKKES
jgi:TRAP-type C4-dicarboxylate transport system permease small subunit